VEPLRLADAYARYRATIPRGQPVLSALTSDGAVVLSCNATKFDHPLKGVLRYEDAISTDPSAERHKVQLGTHLKLAHEGALPIRLVIVTPARGPLPRIIGVRPDLTGKVTTFDGDRFIVDFSRPPAPEAPPKAKTRHKR
jgi:hypothetical protein